MTIVLNIFGNYFDTSESCALISKDVFENYIVYLKRQTHASDNTINSYLRGVRAMLNYFMELGYVEPFKIRLPKVDKVIKQGYSDREITLLLERPKLRTFTAIRNWAVVNYLMRNWKQDIYCM